MSGRALATLALALALTCPAGTPAGAMPPPVKHTPYSAYNHNGFLMRLGLGFGYTRASFDAEDDSFVLTGGGGFASLAFGGMIARNLAINADLFGMSAFEPAVKQNGNDLGNIENTAVSLGAFGIGVTYYLMPANVYFAASFGAAIGRVETRFRVGPLLFVEERESDIGFALNVMIGKEWWVGPEFGLGLAGQLIIGNIPASGGDIHPFGVGVALSVTYN